MSALTRREWLKVAAASPVALAVTGGLYPPRAGAAPGGDEVQALVDKALGFYKGVQKSDGNFIDSPQAEPGLTALIAAAFVRNGVPADNPVIAKAIKYLEKSVKPDGGVYIKGLSNYMTCLAIMAFKEMNAGGKYDKEIEAAVREYLATPRQDAGAMFDFLYAQLPAHLQAQRDDARRYAVDH